jgi:hypothetical protein
MNKHMTFMSKQCTWHQCSNNTSRWMTSMFISYKLIKSKFHITIITKSWPMWFVMKLHMQFVVGIHIDENVYTYHIYMSSIICCTIVPNAIACGVCNWNLGENISCKTRIIFLMIMFFWTFTSNMTSFFTT